MTAEGHSEEFIAEMKERLEKEKAELEAQVSNQDDAFPEYGRNEESNADEVAEFITNKAVSEAESGRLAEVTAALERIGNGTYGVTTEGDLIPEERLRANPAATTTVA